MKIRIRNQRAASVVAVLVVVTLLSGFACNQAKSASVAVNKYANSLSKFQDAEIQQHNDGKVDDATHRSILNYEKIAAKAGRNLDQAILLANTGGDAQQYIDQANNSFNDLVGAIVTKDEATKKTLQALADVSSALLKNAISLIKAITPQNQPKPTSSPNNGAPSLVFAMLSLFLVGMAAGGGGLQSALDLLLAVTKLEPIAFDLILNLAKSLAGKTTEEVLAMNETIFGKVEQTADDELKKLDDQGR
jgi:hypothetical protein